MRKQIQERNLNKYNKTPLRMARPEIRGLLISNGGQ